MALKLSILTKSERGAVLKYFTKRLVALVLIIIAISIGSFYMIHLLPGDLATMILGTGNTPENKKRLYAQLGLDKGLVQQYLTWMSHVLQGDLGKSYITGESINTSIGKALPIDIEVIVISQILAFACAIPLAMKAAKKPNGLFDRMSNGVTFGLLSVPSFIIVVYLVLLIALKLHVPGTGPASFTRFPEWGWILSDTLMFFTTLKDNLMSLLIPSLTLSIGSFVVYFRVLRSDLIATLQEEYITMARSKGLSRRRIMWRHAFRPSSIALLGTAGINIGGLIAGGFVV
ncbi:MAG: ABC transporter permease subunit, partial [Actinobacteria bacterium]|nr:ABC transporter permease subunit [Actinomycetota bacterium]